MQWRFLVFVNILLLSGLRLQAQSSGNIHLRCNWQDTTHEPALPSGQHWNDVYGFKIHGHEYAVIGGTAGAHVIDIDLCQEKAWLPGPSQGTVHRDFKTFGHYLYAVADEGRGALQVYDFNYLPDSVHLVYQSDPADFQNAHKIFIDTASARLYCASLFSGSAGHSNLRVYSLKNPELPVFLADVTGFDNTSDMYVRHDTAWCSNGNSGYQVIDMSALPVTHLLGTLSFYPYKGYNHSSWVGFDGIGVMADETFGMPLKVIDATHSSNIRVISTFSPRGTDSTCFPHNPYLLGHYAVISYYLDGLQVYDLSDPAAPVQVGYYDTYPGANAQVFAGAWGCYPYLPSHKILISDMESGLYVFDISEATPKLGISEFIPGREIYISPNPVDQTLSLYLPPDIKGPVKVEVFNMQAEKLWGFEGSIIPSGNSSMEVSLPAVFVPGIYILRATAVGQRFVARFTKR